MKKLLLLAFFVAARVYAQDEGQWSDVQDFWVDASGGDAALVGTVSSVGIDASAIPSMNVANSPIVDSGNIILSWASLAANVGLMAPDNTTGTPTWRVLVPRDLGTNGSNGQCITQATATTFGRGACSGGGAVATDAIFDTKGDMVAATGADAATKVPVGADGTFLGGSSAASNGVAYVNPFMNINDAVLFDQDFCGQATNTSVQIAGSGLGPTGNTASGGSSHPCVRVYTVGTATGVVAIEGFNTPTNTVATIENGGGNFYIAGSINVSSVGDGTDVIKYYFGGCSTAATGDCNNGMYLRYDRSVSTTNWYLCAADNGSRTCTDTTIAVPVGANYTTFQITSVAANNAMSCIINGTACATGPTTNLPGAGHPWVPMIKADKTAGATTTFTMNVDMLKVVEHFTARTN